jgi:hypothetical protein
MNDIKRSPKEIAIDIYNGDKIAELELEKMLGKKFKGMAIEERRLGVTFLSAFDGAWNK